MMMMMMCVCVCVCVCVCAFQGKHLAVKKKGGVQLDLQFVENISLPLPILLALKKLVYCSCM